MTPELQVPKAQPVLMVRTALMVLKVQRVHKELQVLKAQMVRTVLMVLKAQRVPRVLQVPKVQLVLMAMTVRTALMVLKAQQAHKVPLVLRELKAQLVLKARQVVITCLRCSSLECTQVTPAMVMTLS